MQNYYSLVIITVLLLSCTQKNKEGKVLNLPTAGTVKIAIDASLKPLFEAELKSFESTYPNADVQEIYTSEKEAVSALLRNSVEMIVVTRTLTKPEVNAIAKDHVDAHAYLVAYDGVALIVNRANPDSMLTLNQLKAIVTGNVKQWKQIRPTSALGNIALIFDQPNSGIVRFLCDTLAVNNLPPYAFGLPNEFAVVDYISKNKNGLGLIDASWISDSDDSVTHIFRKTIGIVRLSNGAEFHKPLQAHIAEHGYPLTRKIFMVSREPRAGLASGFITYVSSSKGQRIVLKAGLVPVRMPPREVSFNNKPF